jgi:hypothetical protein
MAPSRERPITRVPGLAVAVLIAALCAQTALRMYEQRSAFTAHDLSAPPPASVARAASFGDPLPLAKVLMLYLQAFDYRAGNLVAYQALDYAGLEAWLSLVLVLDPDGQYPLMSASRVYADVPQEAKQRRMLDFVYRKFFDDPGRRWPWLAHAAAIAKHRLKDPELARTYAAAIQQHATAPTVPTWARQMEAFILEDMDELETARLMIGGFLEKGLVKDAAEARFLAKRLEEIEARQKGSK